MAQTGRGRSGARALVELLDGAKHRFDPTAREEKVRALRMLAGRRILDPVLLVRLHEALCFLQACPDDPAVLDLAEQALRGFEDRVRLATAARAPARRRLDDTGIAGTTVHYPFGYAMAGWLVRSFPGAAEIDWGAFRGGEGLREVLALLVVAPEQDALDDEAVGIREWIRAAKGGRPQTDLACVVGLFDGSPLPYAAKDHLFESLDLPIRWRVHALASRTLAKLPAPSIHYQRGPLRRRIADLRRAVLEPLPALHPLPGPEAERCIHAARCALSVRHRELYGVEHANRRDVFAAEAGRGIRVVVIGTGPDFRLPLEGVYSFLALKNGVPVGYGAGSVLFARLEIALNVFESFRQGESAYLFAQVLRAFHRHFGVTAFLLDRYQIGHGNPEAIASGAFWFFYKLGFRPADPDLARLARQERRRLAAVPGGRSPRGTLIRLCRGDMRLDVGRKGRGGIRGLRAGALGLLATRAVAAARGRTRAGASRALVARVARDLGVLRRRSWPRDERTAFERLALLLAPVQDLHRWPAAQRRRLVRVLRSRGHPGEAAYLRGLRRERRLARALSLISRGGDAAGRPEARRTR